MSKKFLIIEPVTGSPQEILGYGTDEFLNASAGVGDAGKPIVLDAAGKIDPSMISLSGDHGDLSGLGDDDHTQYSLADGTRDYSAVVKYTSHPTFNADTQLVDKKYVDDLATAFDWLPSVLTRLATPPGVPVTGDRYMVIATATGAWVGREDDIAEWNGSSWDFTTPAAGNMVIVEDVTGSQFLFDGASWQEQVFESTTVGDGLQISGNEISIDPLLAGAGLGYAAGVMNVNVDDSSIEVATDTLQVKALGITNAMLAGSISDDKLVEDYIKTSEVDDVTIEFGTTLNVKDDGINALKIDWGLGANQVSAADVPIADAGTYTDETQVEGALQELYGLATERGVELTSAGVTKGDVLYCSANDTVDNYSNISTFHKAIGIANATVGAASIVKSLANDTRIDGVVSGMTAGDVLYWDGTNHVNSMPSTSGNYVIQSGVALNATDMYIELRIIKKNI